MIQYRNTKEDFGTHWINNMVPLYVLVVDAK